MYLSCDVDFSITATGSLKCEGLDSLVLALQDTSNVAQCSVDFSISSNRIKCLGTFSNVDHASTDGQVLTIDNYTKQGNIFKFPVNLESHTSSNVGGGGSDVVALTQGDYNHIASSLFGVVATAFVFKFLARFIFSAYKKG